MSKKRKKKTTVRANKEANKSKKSKKVKKRPQKIESGQLEKVVKSVIAKIVEIDVKKIKPDTDFAKDLNMNSMTALEILAALEKIYKIEIPEEYLPRMRSLKDILKVIQKVAS